MYDKIKGPTSTTLPSDRTLIFFDTAGDSLIQQEILLIPH